MTNEEIDKMLTYYENTIAKDTEELARKFEEAGKEMENLVKDLLRIEYETTVKG